MLEENLKLKICEAWKQQRFNYSLAIFDSVKFNFNKSYYPISFHFKS